MAGLREKHGADSRAKSHGTISSLVSQEVKAPLKSVRDGMRMVLYSGKGRWCPVCGRESRKFAASGVIPRDDALCVYCGSLERHRFVWLYLSRMTDLFDDSRKTVLHVAPENCFKHKLKEHFGDDYVTADLEDSRAMVTMDITDIQYPDGYFDVVLCSHVLEHVTEDRMAMKELHRVLKDDGWAILLVPITAERTFEDPSIRDPAERLRVFGQEDHVRCYGPDFVDRLQETGFHVTIARVSALLQQHQAAQMGLTAAAGDIFYCEKRTVTGKNI